MIRHVKTAAFATIALMIGINSASAEGVRVRGELTSINANTYTVETSAGQSIRVTLKDPVVLVYSDIGLDDVAQDAYVSVPSIAIDDNTWRALGLTVFPEPMRGMNEGFDTWDLTSDSKMTNATIAQVVARGGEQVLTLSYGGEMQTVVVPDTAPITTFAPNPERALSEGDLVVIFADDSGGAFTGKFVAVHADGSLPPV